ncbi:hypothetical protein AMS68_003687 [Peltaster fructicola]|uniref:Uncharacterized protein n=1 Tax=Peltaster fructicola TaxID=286661 RepID=A0A6H0XUP7_9PEZI|nr:hypothetical protein AMS68_003687 [Peltaster fructicola]
MTYDLHRLDTLSRLGIEQLPEISIDGCEDFTKPHIGPLLAIRTRPVPGRKCPNCLSRGQTVWVIPGKRCPQCGHEVN